MAFHCRRTSQRMDISQLFKTTLMLSFIVVLSSACNQKRLKNDVDNYLNANVHSKEDLTRELEAARKQGLSNEGLETLAKSADTSVSEIVGTLETKGLSHADIADAGKAAGMSIKMGSADSSLDWKPAQSGSILNVLAGPKSIGPRQFVQLVARLEVAKTELEELVVTAPQDWSITPLPSKCLGPRTKTKACIIQDVVWNTLFTEAATGCSGLPTVVVRDPKEIRDAIEKFDEDCLQIEDLKLFSHGSSGVMSMGLSISNADAIFLGTSHLFADNAKIRTVGCSVGDACLGSVLMLKVARHAFAQTSGKVESPTQIVFSTRFGGDTSDILESKHIYYSPIKQSADWSFVTAVSEKPSSLRNTCGNDIAANIHFIKLKLQDSVKLQKCAIAKVSLQEPALDSILKSISKLLSLPENKLDNARLRALANVADLLKMHATEMGLSCK